MKVPSQSEALGQIKKRLLELHGVPDGEAEVESHPAPGVDAIIRVFGDSSFPRTTFAVEWKSTSRLATVDRAVRQVKEFTESQVPKPAPLVAVPFMGQVGRELCQREGVSWLDLSGNARIEIWGLRVRIEGRPNQFKKRGRPSTAFAPKGSRIARWLLMHPRSHFTQRDLARATEMDEGYTSKIVSRLEEDGLIERDDEGALRARDPDLLLDAWREVYDFAKHDIVHGHLPGRSGDGVQHRLAERLRGAGDEFAMTGLGAAWMMTRFAGFRLSTAYVRDFEMLEALEDLGFRQEERGANLWIVIPNDEGVFQGGGEVDGLPCVHPVQVYLDLLQHPERAAEAAERLRSERLRWASVDG